MGDMADYYLSQAMDPHWDYGDSAEMEPHYPLKLDRGPGLCPKCSKPTIEKKGKYGLFYGCSTFPKCTGSRCYI